MTTKGYFGQFGGSFVPEPIQALLDELEVTFDKYKDDPEFLAEPPEETPVVDNELLKRSAMDGEFDNFTYINQSNMSEIDRITTTQSLQVSRLQ